MKILHFISSVNLEEGGPAEAIKQLGQVLVAQGHVVEVASLDPPNASWLKGYPLKVYGLGAKISRSRYRYSKHFVPWVCQNASNYDVFIINGIWQYASFAVWLALRSLRQQGLRTPPYFVFTHGMLDPWCNRSGGG